MSGRRSRISVRPNLARPGARTEAKVEKTDSSTAANAQQSADGNEPQESNNAKPAVATRRSRISVKPNIASKPVMPKEQPVATTTPASNSPAQSAAVLTRVARCATRASFNKESSEETLPATSENVIAVQEAEETTSQEASTSNSDTSVVSKGLVTNSHAQPPSKAGTRSTVAETVTPGKAANKELCASTNESSALSCDNVDNRRPALTARRARVSARPNLVPKVTQPVVQKKITGRQGSNARPAEAETPPLAPSQNADQARNTEREPQVSSAEVVIPPSRAAATFVVPSSLHIPSAGSVEQHSATADASHATCESQQSKLADEHGKMDRMAAVRSRHKFRPNLLEAARARKRHLSASCSESETEDVLGRQPPSTQRTTGLTLSIPSPSQVGRDEHAVANRVATPSTPQPSATPSSSEQSTHTARERRTSVLDIESEKEKLVVMKRRQRHRWTAKKPPDKSNMTMMDLIYWNPKNNCMPSRDKSPSRSTAASTQGSEISQPSNVPIEGDTAQAEVKDDEEEDVLVPQVKLGPDGSIILNEDSLVIDTSLKKDAQEKEVVYEDARDTYTTYGSFSKRTCSRAWSDKDTAKFFKALSTVGTDFSMMGSLFPNRKRIELKNKFKREERVNKTKVDKAIRDKQSFDLSVFDKSDTEDEEVATKKPIKKEKKQQRARKKTENNEGGATKPAKKSKRKNRRKTNFVTT
ncbi:PREDICTED: transcription factor TFIIIB component B'' homolog [Priapulus caudatus]|uniref:Transcription factor TFIIIB component B'' homolog n=1 Tax=Priapulus caudatus TaxID=37621 RepID=A0ABM1DUY8_PRICU|nr:PREDICTED: transcription factor TFIIIB component B'' homolog [Priapulus caudatus]